LPVITPQTHFLAFFTDFDALNLSPNPDLTTEKPLAAFIAHIHLTALYLLNKLIVVILSTAISGNDPLPVNLL
jgi:hypothetical protein